MRFLFCLLVLLASETVCAQYRPFRQVQLSNPRVQALHVDGAGFLWVSTLGGLYRFDGKHLDDYSPRANNQLLEVIAMTHQGSDTLIAGTEDGKLYQLIGKNWTRLSMPDSVDHIRSMVMLRDTLWMGTRHGLYYRTNEQVYRIPNFPDQPGWKVRGNLSIDLAVDQSGKLLESIFYGGIFRLHGTRREPVMLERSKTYNLNCDRYGRIWSMGQHFVEVIATDSLLGIKESVLEQRNWAMESLLVDDALWVGTEANGLYIIDTETGAVQSVNRTHGLSAKTVTALAQDAEGNIWIGTDGQGLFCLPTKAVSWFGTDQGVLNERVVSVQAGQHGGVLFGTYGGGLYTLEQLEEPAGVSNFLKYVQSTQGRTILQARPLSRLVDKVVNHTESMPFRGKTVWKAAWQGDSLWMAMNHSVALLNPGGDVRQWKRRKGLPSDVAFDLAFFEDQVAVAMEWGAAVLDRGEVIWMDKIDDPDYSSRCLTRYRNRYYFGSRGAGILEQGDRELRQWTKAETWQNFRVTDLTTDSQGRLWACSPEGGLGCFDGEAFHTRQFSFQIWTFGFIGDRIVLGTDQGVYTANGSSSKTLAELEFLAEDPSGASRFFCEGNSFWLDRERGVAYLGSSRGLVALDGQLLRDEPVIPRLYLRELTVGFGLENLEAFWNAEIGAYELPASQNALHLKVGCLRLAGQADLQFRYRTRPTSPWSEPRSLAEIDLAELPAGNLNVEVRAEVDGRPIGEVFRTPPIIVLKPWYLTHAFLGSSALGLLLLFGLILVVRDRNFKRQNRVLEAKVQARTAEIKHQKDELVAKNRQQEFLMKELHHRVKNNLQLMSSINSIRMRNTKEGPVLEVLRDNQARIDSLALMHSHFYQKDNPDEVQFDEYLLGLVDALLSLVPAQTVTLQTDLDPVRLSPDQTIALGLVVNELISNVLKHAFPEGEKGTLRIDLKQEGKILKLTVADDGVGLPAEVHRNFGLQVVHTLVRQVGATLTATNEGGTRYLITLQLNSTDEHSDR